MKKIILSTFAVMLFGVSLAACSSTTPSAVSQEQRATANDLQQLLQSQPVPNFNWSQLRQTLIDIETAQAQTTQTTSFMFNMGVTDPISSCPSIGFPLAATTELTNPKQAVWNSNGSGLSGVSIAQIDPNGVYSGNSTGTYVLCVNADGSTYVDYWEGYVQTVSGPAVWDEATHSIKLTGPSTVAVKTNK